MRTEVFVVAARRADARLPYVEKILEHRFFTELRDAKKVLEYYESNFGEHYAIYRSVLEVSGEIDEFERQ